jgi:hypothetical protein|uniref:Uncharacterized protein n=1 Tax=viral metagenome TaxID=1070528 RepID=A0A6C0J3N5_9ZZZZ
MALIEGFTATTIWKAFTLNSLVSSITIVLALVLKSKFDKYYGRDDIKGLIFTFMITFAVSFTVYTLMHYVVGYGGGQLAVTGTN